MLIRAKGLVPPFRPPIQGLVNGGQARAVAGARVYVLQVNSNPYTSSSISLLDSSTGNPRDSVGNYVLTNEYGGFSIAGNYTCTSGRQVYLYVRGGNSGGDGENPAIGLMASLGMCPESGNFDTKLPFIFVNEVSTVAAAYAMAGSAADATHINSPSTTHDAVDKASAADLANIATGFAYSEQPSNPERKVPRDKIHTLANILSACVNSNSPASDGCQILFANARSRGGAGAVPEDTATAAINIARSPHANVGALFSLQPKVSAPFTPALDSAPADFTLPEAPEKPGTEIAAIFAPQ
jgi:hypothetical protein